MSAAFGGWHGVAIAGRHAIGFPNACHRPANCPFHTAMPACFLNFASERTLGNARALANLLLQIISQPIGEAQNIAFWCAIFGEAFFALPPNFHATKQIGFGFGHGIKAAWQKGGFAKNLFIGGEGDGCAALIFGCAFALQLGFGQAPRIFLRIERFVTHDFHQQIRRQRIDHRNPHTMQAPRCFISITAKLAASMKRGHNNL